MVSHIPLIRRDTQSKHQDWNDWGGTIGDGAGTIGDGSGTPRTVPNRSTEFDAESGWQIAVRIFVLETFSE